MKLSKNERSLIELFIVENKKITAKEISDKLNISTKTVYRMIKRINELSSEGEIIESYIGKGLVLNYSNYLKLDNLGLEKTDDVENRVTNVLLELLFRSPRRAKLDYLYESYYVSSETIYTDIERIKEFIEPYHLELKKENQYLRIVGTEKNIRSLSYLLVISTSILNKESYSINDDEISQYDADFLTSQLEMIEQSLGGALLYPYSINIFSHLYILLSRYRKGSIKFEETIQCLPLDDFEKNLIEDNQGHYEIAQKVVNNIGSYLSNEINSIEVFHLFQYIISARINTKIDYLDYEFTKQSFEECIRFMETALKYDFDALRKDENFLSHFHLMLYRSKNEILVKNEILNDITREYQDLYEGLVKFNEWFSLNHQINKISNDELGFLVLYFAKVFEQRNAKKKIIIMCSSGVGTSELLKVKVGKYFPHLEIVDVVSVNQFKKKYPKTEDLEIDFILSTVVLKELRLNVPVILVSVMFTKQDQEQVKNIMEGY